MSLTLAPEVLAQVDARGDERSPVISHDLGRYYRLLSEARVALRERLTPEELCAIIDVPNGHLYRDQLYVEEIAANVEDGCRLDGLAEKWGIDGAALVRKIERLSPLDLHALADATVRFWHAVGTGDQTRDPTRALD